MALYIIYGPPGAGKGYVMSWFGLADVRKGVKVYSNYALNGARAALDLRDCATEAFAGSTILWDEIGTKYNARNTLDQDEMVLATLSQHRKRTTTVIVATQDPSMLDVQLRRVAACYLRVSRVGPDSSLMAAPGRRVPWWQGIVERTLQPWCFNVEYLKRADDDTALPITSSPEYVQRIWFRKKYASQYNTLELVVPDHLRQQWEQQEAAAWAHAEVPPWSVINGVAEQVVMPAGWSVHMPDPVRRGRVVPVSVEALLAERGIIVGAPLPEEGSTYSIEEVSSNGHVANG